MKLTLRFCFLIFFSCATLISFSQSKKPIYHPCFLMDSVAKNITFIQYNIKRIFIDTLECRQTLLDNIAIEYNRSRDKNYLDALSLIRQYPGINVEGLYTDIIKRLIESDFSNFLNQLYTARGKYLPLQKELVAAMNMIVDGRPFKQKYMGLLNVEISKAKDKKDTGRLYYLEKLKTKIENDEY